MNMLHAPTFDLRTHSRRVAMLARLIPLLGVAIAVALLPACSGVGLSSAGGVEQSSRFTLSSPVVAEGGALPMEFTGDGAGISPPLAWSGSPAGTRSYALIMHHIDAQGVMYSYWILYNIPADVRRLPEDAKGIGTLGLSSRGNHVGYSPPHSAGPGMKTYVLTLYALSASPQLAVPPSEVSLEVLLAAFKDLTLGSADLSVTYTRVVDVANPDSEVRGRSQ